MYTENSEIDVLKRYNIYPMLFVGSFWIIGIITMIGMLSPGTPSMFHFGPGETIFLEFKINTWSRWSAVMCYSFLSQFIHSLMNSTIYAFITNVIRDYKSNWKYSILFGQSIAILYKIYYWVDSICDILLVLTLQLQYWIPGLLADLIVALWTTYNYLKDKQQKPCYDLYQVDNEIV